MRVPQGLARTHDEHAVLKLLGDTQTALEQIDRLVVPPGDDQLGAWCDEGVA